ncbi:MAG TPA: D-glycero-beta-D-manno-heptose 1,7-bisphosphate 7-phosphatase [Gammaproteobacteria bacterium]|jgi:D-glycero-D-manno-heptose 1,7-bisphosphate phosphatase|nr:D-glycero-beta-D-manno-heptose 1,7-bisphosphate 7-phosphatase [Gammaproteobacteria bacterium]
MPFIILDRDGVINHDSREYIKSPEEWVPIKGSLEAIAQLNKAGFHVIIATNQSGIARGYYDLETLSAIHEKLTQALASVGGYIEEIFYCPHHPEDRCLCRKPQPGLIQQIQKKYAIDLKKTYFIGDSYSDIQAARAASCVPILVLTGNGQSTLAQHSDVATTLCFSDLSAAVDYVVNEEALAE